MNLIIFSKGATFEIQDVNFVRRLNFITTNNNFLLWNQTQGRGGGVFDIKEGNLLKKENYSNPGMK